VRWVWAMRRKAAGFTDVRRRSILLSYAYAVQAGDAVEVLLHEFVHVRAPDLQHGRKFDQMETALRARLGLPPACWERPHRKPAWLRSMLDLPRQEER
jgi:hypothetical protein